MKICTFEEFRSGKTRWGLIVDSCVYPVGDNLDEINTPYTLLDALSRWDFWRVKLNSLNDRLKVNPEHFFYYSLDEIRFLPPIPNPLSFRDFYAFETHVKTARKNRGLEMVPEWYEFPVFYFSNSFSFRGHLSEITRPPYTQELDFELEIACVIGKGGKDIPVNEAAKHIAGYAILNDWSARDIQLREMKVGLGPAKGKDFATSMGPWLVTTDELEAYSKNKGYDLEMRAYKNDTLISKGNFADISYSFAELLHRASEGVYINPGEIIGSGTVGSGCILEKRPENTDGWVKPGDVIRLEVDHLGTLENKIIVSNEVS